MPKPTTMLKGRYRFDKLLAEGGMSFVFAATDVVENKIVAVKVLKPEYIDNAEYVSAFEKEAGVLSKLEHENIVHILQAGMEGKLKYFIMEYVRGKSLKQLLQEDTLSLDNKVSIAMDLCDALEYAHSQGVVHKDLKPENIVIKDDLSPILLDFGIADTPEIREETSNEIFGTVHYFSPEQAKGEKTDKSTDIYALGVILYEMFTGELLFSGEDSVAIALKHVHQEPTPPNEKDATLPESLNRIVLKALRKEKNRRYRSLKDMKKDLARSLNEPDGSYITGYLDRADISTRRTQKKQRVIRFIGLGALVLVLAIGIGIFLSTSGILGGEKKATVYMPSLVNKTKEEAENTIARLKLEVAFSYEAHGDVEEGHIAIQKPDAGTALKEGDTVYLVVNGIEEGDGSLVMSDYVGAYEDETVSDLASRGFKPLIRYSWDADVDSGRIMEQYPMVGAKLEKSDTIVLTINKLVEGEQSALIPRVIGKNVDKALAEINACGNNAIITLVDKGTAAGKVTGQTPLPTATDTQSKIIYIDVEGDDTYFAKDVAKVKIGAFAGPSEIIVTAQFKLEDTVYEVLLLRDTFEDLAAFEAVTKDGIAYNLEIGERFAGITPSYIVYLNEEVVYTK